MGRLDGKVAFIGADSLTDVDTTAYPMATHVKTLANEVAAEDIRVNAICPGAVATPMIMANEELFKLFRPDMENPALSTDQQRMRRHEPNH